MVVHDCDKIHWEKMTRAVVVAVVVFVVVVAFDEPRWLVGQHVLALVAVVDGVPLVVVALELTAQLLVAFLVRVLHRRHQTNQPPPPPVLDSPKSPLEASVTSFPSKPLPAKREGAGDDAAAGVSCTIVVVGASLLALTAGTT